MYCQILYEKFSKNLYMYEKSNNKNKKNYE